MLHQRQVRHRRLNRRRYSISARTAVALALTALAISACSSTGTSEGAPNESNDPPAESSATDEPTGTQSAAEQVLKFGISSEIPKLLTGQNQGTAVTTVNTLIHRGLMAYDGDGGLIPGIAQSVENPQPDKYVFKLRPDLRFSDGSPITPEVVKADLEFYADKQNELSLYEGFKYIDSIETTSDTVTLNLDGPDTALLQWLAIPNAAIVPTSALNSEAENNVGAGPFKWGEYSPGVSLQLVKNPDYYDASDVQLDAIELTFYADASARVNALLSGSVDIIDYVPWAQWDQVAAADDITIAGQSGPFQYVQFNVTKEPFNDPKVRQAVAYAVNRENSVEAGFGGHGEPLFGVAIPKTEKENRAIFSDLWEQDVDKAKSLLAEAGYPNGFTATLLSTSQYAFLQDEALSVQADLKAIGIETTLDLPDWATRVKKGNSGDYDLAVSGGAGLVTDPSYLIADVTGSGFNNSYGYDNPDLNAALEAGLRAATSSEQTEAYKQAAKIIQEDVPFASLNTREQAYAFNGQVQGFQNLPGFLTYYSGYSFVGVHMSE